MQLFTWLKRERRKYDTKVNEMKYSFYAQLLHTTLNQIQFVGI